jgi:diguanylate cyclase (GGDEF)-like protein
LIPEITNQAMIIAAATAPPLPDFALLPPEDVRPNGIVVSRSGQWAFVHMDGREHMCFLDKALREGDSSVLAVGDAVQVDLEGDTPVVRGIAPRRTKLSRLAHEHSRLTEQVIAVNVDNFLKFRESNGELAAEEAIKRVAKIVKDHTSPVGKAARIGGDEFAMLLPEKNKREASYVAEEVRKKVEATNVLRDGKANLTVSVGVSENPIDGATSDELFKKAMDSVEQAKLLGKNRVVA